MTPTGPLAVYTDRLTRQQRDSVGFPELVDRLRAGPPLLGLFGLPVPREWFNLHEFFVHHGDVRRPAGQRPRPLGTALEQALWRRLRGLMSILLRPPAGIAVELVGPDGAVARAGRGSDRIRVA